jgi:hypothetical protein
MNMKREFIPSMQVLLQLRPCLHCLMECSRDLVNSFAVAAKIATSQAPEHDLRGDSLRCRTGGYGHHQRLNSCVQVQRALVGFAAFSTYCSLFATAFAVGGQERNAKQDIRFHTEVSGGSLRRDRACRIRRRDSYDDGSQCRP